MSAPYRLLKVEDAPVVHAPTTNVVAVESTPQTIVQDLDYWRKLAIQNGERLQYAENQLKDLRVAADEARARFGKYKTRLDAANARLNEQQLLMTKQAEELESSRARLVKQEALAAKIAAYRHSLLESGPIWAIFEELALGSAAAGEKG